MVTPNVRFSVKDMKKKQGEDPVLNIRQLQLGEGIRQQNDPDVKVWMRKRSNLFLEKAGILYITFYQGRKKLDQLVVPDSLVPDVLQLKYDEAGYMSASKTKKLIQREYYWLSVDKDTKRYCETCFFARPAKIPY